MWSSTYAATAPAGAWAPNARSPRAPKTLPARSTHVSSPAAESSPASQARASSCCGDQHGRVTPAPGKAPKRASASIRDCRRDAEIVITDDEYSLDFPGEGFLE